MKFVVRAKRRRAGIYLVRMRRHLSRVRRENGYVGRSNNVPIRIKQHMGQDRRHQPKSWTDLDPVWHVLWLPWWLSWKWVQAPLEALAIWLLAPRYNHALNLANPRRVPLSVQARQRRERDGQSGIYRAKRASARFAYLAAGWTLVLGGLALTIWSNTK